MEASTTFVDAVDKTQIFTRIWLPTGTPKAVLHILHGMAEHSERYSTTAEYFTQLGYAVYAHDHRGHGETATSANELGHYADNKGWDLVVSDVYSVNQFARSRHHGLPIFIFGHSMGSFITYGFLQAHPNLVDGVILSGSAFQAGLLVQSANRVAKLERFRQGPRGRSKLMDFLTFSSFNKPFKKNGNTDFDWLSRDPAEVNKYIEDPKCSFIATNQTWVDLSSGLLKIFSQKKFATLPKEIPYYVFSGSMDPVGNNGKAIGLLLSKLNEIGVKNIEKHIYPEGRHEMLNEINRHEVLEDLSHWTEKQVEKIMKSKEVAA